MAETTPITSGNFPWVLKDTSTGLFINDATVTATVYNPTGDVVANAVTMTPSGQNDGVYNLAIDPDWSADAGGNPIEGQFIAQVLAVRGSVKITERAPFTVSF